MARKPTRARQLGITDVDYARRLVAQGGGCAICGARPGTRKLHVDHDHKTGAVRDLLSHNCNRGLGYFNDDAWRVASALAYLVRHSGNAVQTFDVPGGTVTVEIWP